MASHYFFDHIGLGRRYYRCVSVVLPVYKEEWRFREVSIGVSIANCLLNGLFSAQRVVDKLIAWTIRECSIYTGMLGSKFDF